MSKTTSDDAASVTTWDIANEVAQSLHEPLWAVKNVIQLLNEENTIPFIARYRKERTNNMDGEKLRELESLLEELRALQSRITSVIKLIEKSEKMTEDLRRALVNARTLSEVEHLYQPFKTGNKRTMARRAIELGLSPAADKALSAPSTFSPLHWMKKDVKGLETVVDLETGVQHIVADRIAKDKDTIEFLIRDACGSSHIMIEACQSKAKKEKETEKKDKQPDSKSSQKDKIDNSAKFENYFNFRLPIRSIRPHQVLAINRGESLKVLTVKVDIPDIVQQKFSGFCDRTWLRNHRQNECAGTRVVRNAVADAYTRLMVPLVTRHFRNELKKMAEKASLEVFRENLKNLLLAPPSRGHMVLGVDPGFKNGCKLAVVDLHGEIKDTGVVYLNYGKDLNNNDQRLIHDFIEKHKVDVLAIGNGTACRETELSFSSLLSHHPNVSYVIVDESGASIYSVTPDADKEMPGLDPNLRSAASIARRLQDPLAELVKIEPRHIGVGMYQHDLEEKQLKVSLDKVVEDCVSFVGADVNTASVPLLARVAGLTVSRAKKIVEWRDKNGSFNNREQLKLVTGLGPKSFEQCAGFLRINPSSFKHSSQVDLDSKKDEDEPPAKKIKVTAKGKGKAKPKPKTEPDPLDMTCIHPESYSSVSTVLKASGLNITQFSKEESRSDFQRKLKAWSGNIDNAKVADELAVGLPTLDLIIRGLTQPVDFDLRSNQDKPLFRKNLTSMKDLHQGVQLTGRITNVTHFGAFVDIGVERNGLIHVSKMGAARDTMALGDRVEVSVIRVDFAKGRIELELSSGNRNKTKIKLQ